MKELQPRAFPFALRASCLAISLFMVLARADSASEKVIVGFDYRDIYALLESKAGTNVYVDNVTRNRAGSLLFINFVVGKRESGNYRTATLSENGLSLESSPPGSGFDEGGLLTYWRDDDSFIFRNGARLPRPDVRNILSEPGSKSILVNRAQPLWPAVAYASAPTNFLFTVTNAGRISKLYSSGDTIFLLDHTGRRAELEAKILRYSKITNEWRLTDTIKLPLAGNFHDMDPAKEMLIIGELSDFAPSCFEYNLKTGEKRLLGFCHGYFFYLEKPVAERLRALQRWVVLIDH